MILILNLILSTIKDLDSIDSLNKKKSKNGELKDSENKGFVKLN